MATTITRESMTDNVTVWNVTRIGSAIYDRIDSVLGSALTLGGVLTVEAFGAHTFSAGGTGLNALYVRNTTSGTSNHSGLLVGNNSTATLGALFGFSSAYTTAGAYFASGVTLESTGTGGLQLFASNASGPIRMYTGGTQRLAIDSAGLLTPLNSLTIASGVLAYNSANDTGVVNAATVDFDTEVFDEAASFATDTFTAPVAGRYLIAVSVSITNTSGGASSTGAVLVTSNRRFIVGVEASVGNNVERTYTASLVCDMDASDTAYVEVVSSAGTCTINGASGTGGSNCVTYFSARLVL